MISLITEGKIVYPCMGCTKRKIGCHGKCEAYKQAAAANLKVNQAYKNSTNPYIERESTATTKRRIWQRNKGYAGRERGK